MARNYIQPGEVIDYAHPSGAAADIVSGGVVLMGNAVLGVALADIAKGTTGPVRIRGVFEVPKVSGAVIGQGETLTWDASAAAFDDNVATPAVGDLTGAGAFAAEGKGAGTTTIKVMLTGVPGTYKAS